METTSDGGCVPDPAGSAPHRVPGRGRRPGVEVRQIGPARLTHGFDRYGRIDLPTHERLHGRARPFDLDDLVEMAAAVGLCERDATAFPFDRKLRAVADAAARRATRPVVVVDGTEREPGSAKDAVLLTRAPHLVLDGAEMAAAALGAREIVVGVRGAAAAASVRHAIMERGLTGMSRVVLLSEMFLTGESGPPIRAQRVPYDGAADPTAHNDPYGRSDRDRHDGPPERLAIPPRPRMPPSPLPPRPSTRSLPSLSVDPPHSVSSSVPSRPSTRSLPGLPSIPADSVGPSSSAVSPPVRPAERGTPDSPAPPVAMGVPVPREPLSPMAPPPSPDPQPRPRPHHEPVRETSPDAIPAPAEPGRFVPPGRARDESGAGETPALLSNAETLAQLAVVASLGVRAYREVGIEAEPGTVLLTVGGSARFPAVVEIPTGAPLVHLLDLCGASIGDGVLIGGYHGAWLARNTATATEISSQSITAAGGTLGAGVIMPIGRHTCPLGECATVAAQLAADAERCASCRLGTTAIASALARLAAGHPDGGPDGIEPGPGWPGGFGWPGGGAECHHLDGMTRFASTALDVFAADVTAHLDRGTCGRPILGLLPVRRTATALPPHHPGP